MPSDWEIRVGDAAEKLREMEEGSVQTCVTSPPYWGLRDYGVEGQLGLEDTPKEYVENLVGIFEEVRRVLTDDGTLWLNLGDCYASSNHRQSGDSQIVGADKQDHGRESASSVRDNLQNLKEKDLVGIPWRVAFALQEAGWYLRSDIVWHKSNPTPEPVEDRPTSSHEFIFLLTKSKHYYYDYEAIKEPRETSGDRRNKRDVWKTAVNSFPDVHFATYPCELIRPCILAGSAEDDTVLDPFVGAGTTGMVAVRHNRNFVGIDLKEEYAEMARKRIRQDIRGWMSPFEDDYPEIEKDTPASPNSFSAFQDEFKDD